MKRRAKLVVVTSGAAIAALAICVTFRAALLETLLRAILTVRGVPAVTLSVEEFGWHEIAISDLTLGTRGELRARRVNLTYEPRDLVFGRLQAVVLDGLTLTLDATGAGPLLGSLQEVIGSGSGNGTGPGADTRAVPPITLSDGRVEVLTLLGPVSGRIDGDLRPGAAGGLAASLRFDLQGEPGTLRGTFAAARTADGELEGTLRLAEGAIAFPGAVLRGLRGEGNFHTLGAEPLAAALDLTLGEIALPGAAFEQARIALRLTGRRLDLDADLATADGQLTLRADAGLDNFVADPTGRIRLEANIGAAAVLWPLLGLPAPAKGRVQASLDAEARLPPVAELLSLDLEALTRMPPEHFAGHLTLTLSDIDYLGTVQGLSGEVRLDTRLQPETPRKLAGTLQASLTAARASYMDVRASQVALNQVLKIQVSDEKVIATMQEPGKFSANSFAYSPVLASDGPLSAQLMAGVVSAAFGGQRNPEFAHDITLAPEAVTVSLSRPGQAKLRLALQARELRATGAYRPAYGYAGRVRIEDGTAALPGQALAVEHLNATLDLARDGQVKAAYDIGALRHTGDPPALAPLSLRGEVRKFSDNLDFSATGGDPSGAAKITLSGRHSGETGKGTARLSLAPLTFAPGGAQPSALFPALADLRNVTGQARAEAVVSWDPKGLSGTAALTLDDLSLDGAAARIEGLSLDLTLNRIQPPGSAPGQVLRVRRIDPGVPIQDLSMRFQILPKDPPAIGIAEAEFSLAGGRFRLADVVIDPAKNQQYLPIRVEGLDLTEIFTLLGVEGLSGDGRLSGTIPLRVSGGIPAIASGRLLAQGAGRLRVKSDYAKQALASAGESADLLLRALEDFRYEELSLTLDQPSPERALIGLSMLGNNPQVEDGHPFRFNINLETDPRKLIATLQEAFSISNRAVGQMWMFGR